MSVIGLLKAQMIDIVHMAIQVGGAKKGQSSYWLAQSDKTNIANKKTG
jgi:hypothetical protein